MRIYNQNILQQQHIYLRVQQLTGFNFQQHGGVTMERQEPDDDLDQDMDGLDESRQDDPEEMV